MNEKQKKIVEYGIALAIIAMIIPVIHQNLTARMNTSFNLLFPLLMLPISIVTLYSFFAALHYYILQKTLNRQHPFEFAQQVLPFLPPAAKNKPYGILIIITASLIPLGLYFTYVKQFIKHLNPLGTFMLFFAGVTTTTLLIFRKR